MNSTSFLHVQSNDIQVNLLSSRKPIRRTAKAKFLTQGLRSFGLGGENLGQNGYGWCKCWFFFAFPCNQFSRVPFTSARSLATCLPSSAGATPTGPGRGGPVRSPTPC